MRNSVFFVCEGRQHLSSAIVLAEALNAANIPSILFYPHELPEPARLEAFTYYSNDHLSIPGLLQWVGLVVLFTNESSPHCIASTRVSFIAKKTNTPCVTIQHGWIQPGLNFESDMRNIGFWSSGADSSRAIWHFSEIIGYFGKDGIGFPGLSAEISTPRQPASPELNVLIATNFNWGVYSKENIVGFLRAIRALGARFPSIQFAHRPHPAESSEKIQKEIGFYMDIADVPTGEWQSTDDALAWADVVISTPSTFVLDGLAQGVPTYVYSTETFSKHLGGMEEISFSTPNKLVSQLTSLVTEGRYEAPDIPRFNAERFLAQINSRMKAAGAFELREEDYLNYVSFVRG
jgi:hypothetical protein